MYKYTFNGKESNDIASQMNNLKEVFQKYVDIDQKYNINTEPLNLEKLKFQDLTDEEVDKMATKSLEGYKTSGVADIENKFNDDALKIDDNIAKENKNAENKKIEAVQLHSSLKDSAAKDSIKRGLGRSSIVINVMEAFDKSLIDEYSKINEELSTSISNLNGQREVLESQKNNAMQAFDLNYAIKLQDKIDSINQDLSKKEQEVVEYNNEIEEKERKWQQEREKEVRDYAEHAKENEEAIAAGKYKEKFDVTKEFLLSIPKEDAYAIINNNNYIMEQIGPENLNKLKVMLL